MKKLIVCLLYLMPVWSFADAKIEPNKKNIDQYCWYTANVATEMYAHAALRESIFENRYDEARRKLLITDIQEKKFQEFAKKDLVRALQMSPTEETQSYFINDYHINCVGDPTERIINYYEIFAE